MLEAKKYRQYAKDCVRIAASMSGKDRQTLLDIADAWEAPDGGRDPSAPSVVPDAGS
jgi:predicted lipoprotein